MEITRRNTLLKSLELMEREMRKVSQLGSALMPAKGKEEQFELYYGMCSELRKMIQAHESEPVRRAMADWQREVMDGKITIMNF